LKGASCWAKLLQPQLKRFYYITIFLSQYVSAPTGHPQVEHNIKYFSMVLSMPQRIRCFVIVQTCSANYSTVISKFLQFEVKLKLKLKIEM
jgi:hypothetical protein